MSPLLSRGQFREILPETWLDGEEGWTCAMCSEDQSQDTESFPHPNPKFSALRVCENCHKGE